MTIFTKRILNNIITNRRLFSTFSRDDKKIVVLDKEYNADAWTNINKYIHDLLQRKIYTQKYHPLNHLKKCIGNFFNTTYKNSRGNPLFSIHDSISPLVSSIQNFESVLTPADHPSRQKTDSFYINKEYMLRTHTTAHQTELIKMGLDNFLVIGDVFRRDEIDNSHYPVFHQVDGVRLLSKEDIFKEALDISEISLFKKIERTTEDQGIHVKGVTDILTEDLKSTLTGLAHHLFGKDVQTRWVDSYFPFTCPSWELEILFNGKWMELLGCGVIEQSILNEAGAPDKVGWAFGIGLERLAMNFYSIPDIRYFWSTDPGFLEQFKFEDSYKRIKFQIVSVHPSLSHDLSFWLPEGDKIVPNDLYDVVRTTGGDIIERVHLIDEFVHPKTKKASQCYKIVYRSLDSVLSYKDVNNIHWKIALEIEKRFGVELRMAVNKK